MTWFLVAPLGAQQRRGSLRGAVHDKTGGAVPFAVVTDVESDKTVRADERGVFVIGGLPAGTRAVRVRAIGFLPATFQVLVASAHTRSVTLQLIRQVQSLPDIVVHEPRALAGGLAKRLLRGGRFLTGETLRNRGIMRASESLAWVPGLRILNRPTALGGPEVSFPGCGGARRRIGVWIDGREALRATDQSSEALSYVDNVRPSEIEVVEVYRRFDEIPPEFRVPDACAAIVVWTTAMLPP